MVYVGLAIGIIIFLINNLCGWKDGMPEDMNCQEEAHLHNFIKYGEKK